MRKFFNKTEQRGTLLVEAIAMLGLIALVTPTLYKKSAERLQEIQDINSASQARTMNDVIETLVSTHFMEIMQATSSDSDATIKIGYADDSSGVSGEFFHKGYSSFLPYGYKPNSIRNFDEPEIFVHRDGGTLVSYIVYPHLVDPGKKRAARMASLVGANGGIVTENKEAQGTGGAWFLDEEMLEELEIPASILKENSLVVTANEPIENSMEDNDKYLYRVPPDEADEVYHNMMITDLYMGGNEEKSKMYESIQGQFFGIYNVRKLMMHSRCDYTQVKNADFNSSMCTPQIADLYVGKPDYTDDETTERRYRNNGAAWIYGNLTALNEGFSVTGSGSTTAEMVFRPTYESGSSVVSGLYDIVYATGDVSGDEAEVKLIGDFVTAEKSGTTHTFMVAGSADDSSSSDPMFLGVSESDQHIIRVGAKQGSNVYVAEKGGSVYINASDNADSSMIHSDTHINSGGGLLYMGPDEGGWLTAGGSDHDSSYVNILKEGGSEFTVGNPSVDQSMIYVSLGGSSVVGSSLVSLNAKRFQVYADNHELTGSSLVGGASGNNLTAVDGFTAVTTKFTDILGSTYLGSEAMVTDNDGDGVYTRGGWTLGVAGSAWVDQTLWARKAWLRDAGMRNLHAGYKNMADYTAKPKTAWLNVYGESSGVGGGRVVIRDPNKITAENENSLGDGLDVMFLASLGVAVLSDTEGAWVQLDHGTTRAGSLYNYFAADKSDSTKVSGSSYVVGGRGVELYTHDASVSSLVGIQQGALELYGHAGGDNKIQANASQFGIKTSSTVYEEVEDSQFYVDGDVVRTRYVDFEVQDNTSSSTVFGVYPDIGAREVANIEMKGSIHVTGNEVIHIADKEEHSAHNDSSRAMFEIDPNYVRVWAKDRGNGRYGDGGDDYYAMLTIAPDDVGGSSISGTGVMNDTSIYIRKGAIELERSDSSVVGLVEADAGFGYIRANRLVSNAGMEVPEVSGSDATTRYDQYMVNPAYTSVMHDIKLTTRGGARLSDILPDYVLKGVYNVSNDYKEGTNTRVGVNEKEWADPYLGNIYFPMCPPGYVGLATVVPISFQMAKTGHAVEVPAGSGTSAKWQVVEGKKHADILRQALSNDGGIIYPGLEEVKSLNWNAIYQSSDTFSQFVSTTEFKTEGWFWGLSSESDEYGSSKASISWSGTDNVGTYTNMAGSTYAIAEPLYFQEGTFLKTSLKPVDNHWEARMGFIYDTGTWSGLGGIDGSDNILSNNTQNGGGNAGGGAVMSGYVWNLFPVVTNTLEGHATVYCYFKRSEFDDTHVLQYNPEAEGYDNTQKSAAGSSNADAYIRRLDDPTLKYRETW